MLSNRQRAELRQRWHERVAWIQSAADAPEQESAEERQRRIARAKKDYAYFVSYYFPHLATAPTAPFQIDAARYIRDTPQARALFEWSRGHAKSSHISLMIPLWLRIQDANATRFMVLVSKSQDAAVALLTDLQAELETNPWLRSDFGEQVKSGSWAEGEFITTDGCKFKALGRGQSPRGLKNRGRRPDYIVIDDIDDDEIANNPARVTKALDWCLSALYGAMQGGRGRFIMVGNRISKTGILARYAESRPRRLYHTVVNMLDAKGQPSWRENYTLAEVNDIKADIGERRFQKEYMNNPINEGTVFLQKHIRYGRMLDLKQYRTLICYTDPSFKDSNTADYKATMLLGKVPGGGREEAGEYHLLRAYAGQESVAQMVRWHYEIDAWISGRVPVLYFMESNFIQDLLLDEFRKTGNACGHHIAIRGDGRKKPDKFARIEGMQPLFERRLIVFNEAEKDSPGMRLLVEQLLMFEKGSKSHDDAPDALEGAVFLLNQRNRTATASYAFGRRSSQRY